MQEDTNYPIISINKVPNQGKNAKVAKSMISTAIDLQAHLCSYNHRDNINNYEDNELKSLRFPWP